MKPLRSKAVKQGTLSAPMRILAVADGGTAMFNLTRYFSALSFILIVLAGGALGGYYRQLATHRMISQAEHGNVIMTQILLNAMGPDISPLLRGTTPAAAILPRMTGLMKESDLVKVKVYDLSGLTLISTEVRQIGESKKDNAGFQAAAAGQAASELTHRNTFSAFDGDRAEVDLISSYVPIRIGGGAVTGVFELYRDVTPLVRQLDRTLWQVSFAVLGALALLYLLQLLVVRHAQRILRAQEAALEKSNRELDRRVHDRTRDLEAEVAVRRRAEERLEHLAHHDPLTGLPNRLMFKQRLAQSLARVKRRDARLAVLFIDLDHFKNVNDTLGHSAGDQLLVDATQRLAASVRGGDTLARLGGDEFVCIIEDIDSAPEVGRVAEKLLGLFTSPLFVSDHEIHLSISIGVSLAPDDGDEVDILVRNADAAMYQAKAHGRNRWHFYAAEITEHAQERLHVESQLRHAAAAAELALHFQPKVDSRSGALTGAEALLRWRNPTLGNVPPARFIPLAEECGLIVELGAWVLEQTCRQVAAWDAAGFRVPLVSVNVSVKQIERGDFMERVGGIFAATGVAPARIEFEITESVIMAVEDAFAILENLRALGIHLSIDDFGTGYSSLAYLKQLPIQTLKIDRAFVIGIGEQPGDEAIIRTIVELARSLGLSTVAEGVETEAQLDFLRRIGCNQIQGYLYGRPVGADEFLSRWRNVS